MSEELQSIDTSAIEQLQTIKQEQDVLQQRLDAMNNRSGQVSEVVYERVRADYLDKYQALEEKARPLKTQARAEYARLSALNQRLTASLEEARLAKEELEFRNELGEFEEKEFKQRLAESESLVKECEKQVAEGDKLRARFVAAFHSEDELTAGEEEPLPPEGKVAGEEQEEPEEQEEETQVHNGEQPPPADPGQEAPEATILQPLPQDPMDAGGTQPLPVEENVVPPPPPAAEAPVGVHSEAATAVLLPARLVQEDDGRVIPVQMPTTTIGRAPNNDIAIPDGTISRHHAKIEFTEDGFVIMDLGSENGIFVNGERVTERLLATGDKVEVGPGTRCYTFLWE